MKLYEKRKEWGKIRKSMLPAVMEKCNNKCANCGSEIDLHIDHITPLSLNGSNELENLQILCKECNLSKGGYKQKRQLELKKKIQVNFRIDNDIYKQLEENAKEEYRTITNLVESIIVKHIKTMEAEV